MIFDITHRTEYRYSEPASEAYLELRMTPPETPAQEVQQHTLACTPPNPMSAYTDYFGNRTHFYSMTLRHSRLDIVNRLRVQTRTVPRPEIALHLTVAEARQVMNSMLPEVYPYLQPTEVVPVGGLAKHWGTRWFRGNAPVGEALEHLNRTIFRHFTYESGSTTNDTPLEKVWRQRRGVCQDFAHIMLSVLRTCGFPCRYVCGYIEADPPSCHSTGQKLIGAVATHAWVEALLPGGDWVALDPTNNCWCGEQHVAVSYGRDFREAAPVIGTFKTSGTQKMKVKVHVRRVAD
jgi:transglutaminase-like putative cysteine protease